MDFTLCRFNTSMIKSEIVEVDNYPERQNGKTSRNTCEIDLTDQVYIEGVPIN